MRFGTAIVMTVMALTSGLTLTTAVLNTPPAAEAAVPSVRLTVCNEIFAQETFRVSGFNQDERYVTSYTFTLEPGRCHDLQNWWWARGQNVRVERPGSGANVPCTIPANQRNGSSLRCAAR